MTKKKQTTKKLAKKTQSKINLTLSNEAYFLNCCNAINQIITSSAQQPEPQLLTMQSQIPITFWEPLDEHLQPTILSLLDKPLTTPGTQVCSLLIPEDKRPINLLITNPYPIIDALNTARVNLFPWANPITLNATLPSELWDVYEDPEQLNLAKTIFDLPEQSTYTNLADMIGASFNVSLRQPVYYEQIPVYDLMQANLSDIHQEMLKIAA
jgi:hypothetical protein